ncbi:MAG: hypothetical protein P4K93_02445 [Terracidiphilus sp.]|nr:hypothetical protein [Terracidiphilus sp.]MDR3796982.1 hypothetical protein [Terracidiphilus sp.]
MILLEKHYLPVGILLSRKFSRPDCGRTHRVSIFVVPLEIDCGDCDSPVVFERALLSSPETYNCGPGLHWIRLPVLLAGYRAIGFGSSGKAPRQKQPVQFEGFQRGSELRKYRRGQIAA